MTTDFDIGYAANGNDGQLEALPNGGTAPYFYQWNDPSAQTTAIAEGLSPATYIVTVTDSKGCNDAYEVVLPLGELGCIKTIMTFTPNNDAVNDYWEIPCLASLPHNVKVFNRWGQVVFISESYDSKWDGTVNGVQLPDGGYFFVIEVTDPDNKEHMLQGALNIIR